MTMQSSGPISIGQAAQECREALSGNHAGDSLLSRLAGVSPGQAYAWSYWYGKSNGYTIVQGQTQFFNVNYTGAMSVNLGGGLVLYGQFQGPSTGDAKYNNYWLLPSGFYQTGGDNTTFGSFQQSAGPGGGTIVGLYRYQNYLSLIIGNGSLDGCRLVTSLGENYALSNDLAASYDAWGTRWTTYAVSPTIADQWNWNGWGQTVTYTYQITGTPVRGQPAPIAPPPDPGGGTGGGSGCCFLAGSMVLMANRSWKAIETLRTGDVVMSPTGPAIVKDLYVSKLGMHRKFMTFREDPSIIWSQEHPFWSRQNGRQWWWADRPDLLREEMEQGLIAGLKNPDSVYGGRVDDYAYLGSGYVKRTPMILEGYSHETPVYIPILDGPPAIVNGYVVGAFLDEHQFDYNRMDWDQLYPTLAAKGFKIN